MRKTLTLLLITILFLFACADRQVIFRKPVPENVLRLDGYYYYHLAGTDYLLIYFLYKDGIIKYHGGTEENLIKYEIEHLGDSIDNIYLHRINYGVFNIDENRIRRQFWVGGINGNSLIEEGRVLSDTAFEMTDLYRIEYGKKKYLSSEKITFNFKQFDRKPDISKTTYLR